MEPVKVALIGFGGIARHHNAAYKSLMASGAPVSLVAVCDRNVEQFTKSITINLGGGDSVLPEGIRTYTDVDDLIANEDFDMADICLPTFLHKEFAVKLLGAGKHVLCEKPMALSAEDAAEMLALAQEKHLRLMIGLDVHFDPYYHYLNDACKDGRFGKLEHLSLWRDSIYPTWGAGDHFSNLQKSGGLIKDMHIHDIDIVQYFFGDPVSYDCVVYENMPHAQLATSRLSYPGFTVLVEGSWDETANVEFAYGYNAKFEHGAMVLRDMDLTVYPYGKEPFKVTFPPFDAYADEISYIISLILDPSKENTVNPPEVTYASTKLVDGLRACSDTKKNA